MNKQPYGTYMLTTIKPMSKDRPCPVLILQTSSGDLVNFKLDAGQPFTASFTDDGSFYCTGWYDIELHSNHICPDAALVKPGFGSCFACRQKTGFNPGFYNSDAISDKQAAYNKKPHSVYVANFGGSFYKAGMMSTSRGLARIHEQGALFYAVVGEFSNADLARTLEARLIGQGLKNSVLKSQKQKLYQNIYKLDRSHSLQQFQQKLTNLGLDGVNAKCNIDTFLPPVSLDREISNIPADGASGVVVGAIGSYLVLRNEDRLAAFWLDKFIGRNILIEDTIQNIEVAPIQQSLL